MSMDEQPVEVNFDQALNMRLSARLGQAAVQIEALQLQNELLQAQLDELRQSIVPMHTENGEHSEFREDGMVVP